MHVPRAPRADAAAFPRYAEWNARQQQGASRIKRYACMGEVRYVGHAQLEQDIQEKEALLVMLEMIIQDKPLSEIAESLNQRAFRTRHNTKWTPGTVFDMLPRLIEVGPRVFTSEEWVVRRGRLMNAV